MNIDQYRAIKAQEASAPATTETPTQTTETVVQPTASPTTQTPAQEPVTNGVTPETTTSLPEKINIDGVGEVSIDELKNGYLRQSDYTRKTQELSHQSKETKEAVALYEHLKSNPQLAQQLLQTQKLPANLDPVQSKVIDLETKMYDMMLEREIENLQAKYADFDVKTVLETADKKGMTNLEDAYLLTKSYKNSSVNMDEVRKQLRQELLKEIEQEGKSTQTIITSGGTSPVPDNVPVLSSAEHKVASMMSMSDSEYIKWRDAGRKK